MKVAHVYLEHPALQLDHTFTYDCGNFDVCRGMRVQVPLKERLVVAFVESVEEVNDATRFDYQLKKIESVIDEKPLIDEELFQLAYAMSDDCIAMKINCFQCLLPSKLRASSKAKEVKKDVFVTYVENDIKLLTKKQLAVYEQLKNSDMLRKDFYVQYKTVGKRLLELGFAKTYEKEVIPTRIEDAQSDIDKILSPQQQKAKEEILYGKHDVNLLYGVTGSGKTEVFLQCAKEVLKQGKQVLILVPEIALTPMMEQAVTARFQDSVAIYHSRLNAQEQYEQYQLVKNHEVSIVVGTRSAVFMPFDNLGLIVMDEEHDASYKQDKEPRYHCRDIVIWRGKYHHAKVVLASATPSLDSYARAIKNVYGLIQMKERFNHCFPSIHLVEMRKVIANKEHPVLSNELKQAIQKRLDAHEQVLLLLNRRGYAPIHRCVTCGYVQSCTHCDLTLVYHKDDHAMKCHSCGEISPILYTCPQCGNQTFTMIGMGTQKLEEYVQACFPNAKLLRMDADTTRKKKSHHQLLESFKNHEADILIGTQMIAKGLDFENVTLVGIINGDAGLSHQDYRSCEVTYHLLEQASGRSGRGNKAGEVYIQCYDPNHYAIQACVMHNYNYFFQTEMSYRHLAGYPPYRYLIALQFHSKDEDMLDKAIEEAHRVLQAQIDLSCKILGPAELIKRRDLHRSRILLKGKNLDAMKKYVRVVYENHKQHHPRIHLDVDVNPLYLE